ncbi:MAG: transporter [Candidatus Omnitrophica bacterium]|nr:transporter [Candidatus Omnitrophota bacterium]
MIIISNKHFFALVFCFVVSLAAVLFAFKEYITKEYDRKFKEKILSELRREVKQMVKSELNNTYAAVSTPDRGRPDKDVMLTLNRKVREMVNLELESYRAGDMEPETATPAGPKKKSEQPVQEGPAAGKAGDDSKEGITKQNAIERTLVERGGMLLPKGTLQIEPGFTSAHFSSNNINIEGFAIIPLFIGEVTTQTKKRDIFISTLSTKYGLLENLQGELRVPYRYEYDRTTDNTQGTETSLKKGGLGDIELSLSRQIAFEHGLVPDTVFSITGKSITGQDPYNHPIGLGTGHWGVRTGLVFVKSSDPAVIFGGLNYSWSARRKFDNFGKVEPGSSVGYTLGAAIALSYQTAINFAFDHSVTFKMKKDGVNVNGSFLNSASLKTGFNWSFSKNASVDFSISHGLTTDAPDYVVELRFPYTF